MSLFLNPYGRQSAGIALCGRCSRKFFIAELSPDPNTPGLMVCRKDIDNFDPYRLPPRQPENISLEFVRPDEPLTGTATDTGDFTWYGVQLPWVIGRWL